MASDRKTFFDHVRATLFAGSLSVEQVAGMAALLDYWEKTYPSGPRAFISYIMATVYHETGRMMVPVREGFAKTDAEAVAYVRRQGYAYAKVGKFGFVAYGRGRVQTTWDANYAKVAKRFNIDCTARPDLLLDPVVDAAVAVTGHVEGIWTGRKLSLYFGPNKSNPDGARGIVNGTDRAAMISGYFLKFDDALAAADRAYVAGVPVPPPPATLLPEPIAVHPAPKPKPPLTPKQAAGSGAGAVIAVAATVAAVQSPDLLWYVLPAAAVALGGLAIAFRRQLGVMLSRPAPVAQVPRPLIPPPTVVRK
jgi:hypothetical protein